MSFPSPAIEGFRAAFRRPSLTFAEITWRWTIGAVGWTLFLFSIIEYLNTLPVTRGDRTLLGTRQPVLIGRAISHILRGSLNRAVLTTLLITVALALMWTIAASIGRAATVRALLDYFRRDVAGNVTVSTLPAADPEQDANLVLARGAAAAAVERINNVSTEPSDSILPQVFRAPLALNFLRLAVSLSAILAFMGAAMLAGLASPVSSPKPALAFILFLLFAASICIAWPTLNWFLSLASIFAIRDGNDAPAAFSAAVTFSRERMGPVFAVSAWTGVAHLVALSVAGTAVSLPLAFVQFVPPRLIIVVIIFLSLAYFAVVDWLYIARLAGYICITEMPDTVVMPATLRAAPPAAPNTPQSHTSIDRNEPILSDLPNLALET